MLTSEKINDCQEALKQVTDKLGNIIDKFVEPYSGNQLELINTKTCLDDALQGLEKFVVLNDRPKGG